MSRISELRRQTILTAACQEFHEHSVKRVSMADIAHRAQIGKSTIYEYFSSKEDLIRQAGLWLLENYAQQIEAVFSPELPLREQLGRYLDAVPIDACMPPSDFMALENMLHVLRILGEESLQEEITQFQTHVQNLMVLSIQTATERGELPAGTDPVLSAKLMQALLNPLCMIQLKRSGLEDAAKQAVQVILAGLAPQIPT